MKPEPKKKRNVNTKPPSLEYTSPETMAFVEEKKRAADEKEQKKRECELVRKQKQEDKEKKENESKGRKSSRNKNSPKTKNKKQVVCFVCLHYEDDPDDPVGDKEEWLTCKKKWRERSQNVCTSNSEMFLWSSVIQVDISVWGQLCALHYC